jgi:prepilin-type N-terminal cleavage/methylation domain-containing protein
MNIGESRLFSDSTTDASISRSNKGGFLIKKSEQKGFTLIEVIVAIAVVAILAGVITPSVIKHLDDSKRARAQNDCLVIGSAIGSFYKDVARMPNMNAAGAASVTLLASEGNIPTLGTGVTLWNAATTAATCDLLINHLSANNPKTQTTNIYPTTTSAPGSEFVWRGPYQTSFPADPWGNRYAINIGNMASTNAALSNAVWVLSAGQDGIIQTAFNPAVPAVGTTLAQSGDDIVYRLK